MNQNKANISALILCGGLSSRMGTDKGLKEDRGIPWAQLLYNCLSSLNIPTFLSVRLEQQELYSQRLPNIPLVVDGSLKQINGPVRGIISAHRKIPQQHLLVVPCDMPRLNVKAFTLWLEEFRKRYATVISRAEQRIQPLCSIYRNEDLTQLDNLYQQRRLTDQSMNAIVKNHLRAHFLDIPEAIVAQYKNFNTPEDEL